MLLLLLILGSSETFAQKGFRLSFRTSFDNTWLINKNVIKDKTIKYKTSFGRSYGIGIGYYLVEKFGISFEVYIDEYNQTLKEVQESQSLETSTKLKFLSAPLMFRYRFLRGIYLEFGPQLRALVNATYGNESTDSMATFSYTSILKDASDLDDKYNKNFKTFNTSLILGTGLYINCIKRLVLGGGVRVNIGLSDLVSKEGGDGEEYLNDTNYTPTKTLAIGLLLLAILIT